MPPWSEIEQLNFEKESLGLYWSGHPVDRYAADLAAYGARGTHELAPTARRRSGPARVSGARRATRPPPERPAPPASGEAVVGGIVSGLRPLKTRKGDRMCVFMLDDARGSVEVVVFPETFKQWGHVAENGRMVVVTGKLERDDESARILATEVAPIEVLTERLSTSVAITVTTPPHDRATVERLWDVLSHHKGDRCVALTIETRPPLRPMRVKRGRPQPVSRPPVGEPGGGHRARVRPGSRDPGQDAARPRLTAEEADPHAPRYPRVRRAHRGAGAGDRGAVDAAAHARSGSDRSTACTGGSTRSAARSTAT